ncbi:MAG TPA: hypothetical protein VF472_12895 [Burkholderiaceae bacterium]
MKTSPDNLLIASRHSMGTVAIPSLGFAAFVRKIKAALGFIAHEASPLAVPAHGFQPENDTLCGAHWNRVYLVSGAKL